MEQNTNKPDQPPSAPKPPAPPAPIKELKIYGHSSLFYWWPIWAFGYLFMAISLFSGSRLAIVDQHARYDKTKNEIRLSETAKPGTSLVLNSTITEEQGGLYSFFERVYPSKNLGVSFLLILILVIFITNVPLRGVTSAVAISLILVLILAIALMGWWDNILDKFGRLAIHMNAGFYGFFSTVLFIAWLMTTFIYDRMNYWRVTPGQITHEYVFGGGQTSFETEGIAFKKLRDDLFRHWILGIGSGDLILFPLQAGTATREELTMHNVMFVGSKLAQVQKLIATRAENA